MNSDDLAARFIDAFKEIEGHFRSRLRMEGRHRFTEMAREYVQINHLPQEYLDALRTFAALRNAISHERYLDGSPIAQPVPATVDRIELLRDQIRDPPRALSFLRTMNVCSASPEDPLSSVLDHVRSYDYSQLPVYHDGSYTGMLTTNAISRWLADQLASKSNPTGDEKVSEVLAFAEPHERGILAAQTLTAADAIHQLTYGGPDGGQVNALIITDHGLATEPPLAVVVGWDLARLLAAVSIT
jgi:hypothetical protein